MNEIKVCAVELDKHLITGLKSNNSANMKHLDPKKSLYKHCLKVKTWFIQHNRVKRKHPTQTEILILQL